MTPSLGDLQLEPKQMMARIDAFMARIIELADLVGLDVSHSQADHIALRINDNDLAKLAHQSWSEYGEVISTAQINGRPIVVIHFAQSIQSSCWEIECLELPFPAVGKVHPAQDWEHVEFVIRSKATTADDYLADLRERFPEFDEKWDRLAELGITTKLSSPKGEGERLANPTIAFKHQGICFKVHPHPLRAIVESEKQKEGDEC